MDDTSIIVLTVVLVLTAIVILVYFINLRNEKIKAMQRATKLNAKKQLQKRPKSGVSTASVFLIEKVDGRIRSIDGKGNVSYSDESYFAVFKTKDGNIIKLNVTRDVLKKIPFNKKGILTYKDKNFIRFKYQEGIIEK